MRRLPLTVLATILALAVVPASADAAKPVVKCQGKKATIVGTKGADTIRGTKKRDVIQARGGADVVNGLAGNDLICGGGGRDQVTGGTGDDAIYLGARSVAFGGAGNDRIQSVGQGLLDGGPGDDILRGGAGKDHLTGGSGDDLIVDRAGDNEVSDASGVTVVRLGSGDDFVETSDWSDIESGGGDDMLFTTGVVFTGPGNDFVRFHVCDSCTDLSSFGGRLGPGNDSITIGDGVDARVAGSPPVSQIDFVLNGGDGNDTLEDWFALSATPTTAVNLDAGSILGPWHAEIGDFENYLADEGTTGPRVFHVTGTDEANIINVFGPDSFIYGLDGNDTLGTIFAANHIDGGGGDDECVSADNQISC